MLAEEFEKLDKLTLTLNKSLGKISVDSKGIRSLTAATNASNRAFERANITASVFRNHLASIHQTGGAIGVAALGAALPGRQPRLPPAGSQGGGGNTPGGGGGGGGGRGGNRPPPGGFHGGNIHMGPGGIGLGTVGMAAGDWFWPLAATGAMVYAGKSLFESAKELDTERQRFKLFGLNDTQNNEAFKFAAGMHVYGATQIENLRNFREAQGVFREAGLPGSSALAGAKLAAPILSKLNALDGALDDESKASSASSNLAMLRFVESAGGLKSQDEFRRLADIGYRLKVGSGDTVNWQQLQQFEKRGLSAAINLTGEGLARIEPSISTLGGSGVGVALRTGFGRLQGIVKGLPVSVISELLESGVWDKSKVQLNSKGGIAKFLDPRGPLSGNTSKLLSENPELFYEQVIRPIYAKMHLDAAGILRQNALIFGNTGGGLANEWEKSLQKIGEAAEAFKKTLGIDAATKQLPGSLTGQEKEFEAAWTDFKTQFGTTMLPFFTGILKGGADLLRMMGHNVKDDHPGQHFVTHFRGKGGSTTGGEWVKDEPSPFIGKKSGGDITVKTQVNLDGQKIGEAVSKVQAKEANRPQTGISAFDQTQGLIPAGGGFAF
jgi:hypothetical protein